MIWGENYRKPEVSTSKSKGLSTHGLGELNIDWGIIVNN